MRLSAGSPVIIVGASARAAAFSMLRAGLKPWCVDLFADRDLRAVAPVERCPLSHYPRALPDLVAAAPPPWSEAETPVLFAGGLENYPHAADAIAAMHPLVGSSAEAMTAVRAEPVLRELPAIPPIRPCHVPANAADARPGVQYLLKPHRGAAGRGIRLWKSGETVDDDHSLQELVTGVPISAIFAVVDGNSLFFGVTEQLVGRPEFGAHEFSYCGSVGLFDLTSIQQNGLRMLGLYLAERFNLRGVFGVDAILDETGDIRPLEVNPRFTASIEILERVHNQSIFQCRQEPLPTGSGLHAKAILFARNDCTARDLYYYCDPAEIADVPAAGEPFHIGQPVCTFFAHGPDRAACLNRLHTLADRLYTHLRP